MATTFLVGDIVTADALNAVADAPYCKLVKTSAQSWASGTADVAIVFDTGSTVYDPLGFHSESTNNTRITPNVAGLYRFDLTVGWSPVTNPITSGGVALFKNGVVITPRVRGNNISAGSYFSWFLSVEEEANGTTDYFEMRVTYNSTTTPQGPVAGQGSYAPTFVATRVRSLVA